MSTLEFASVDSYYKQLVSFTKHDYYFWTSQCEGWFCPIYYTYYRLFKMSWEESAFQRVSTLHVRLQHTVTGLKNNVVEDDGLFTNRLVAMGFSVAAV